MVEYPQPVRLCRGQVLCVLTLTELSSLRPNVRMPGDIDVIIEKVQVILINLHFGHDLGYIVTDVEGTASDGFLGLTDDGLLAGPDERSIVQRGEVRIRLMDQISPNPSK